MSNVIHSFSIGLLRFLNNLPLIGHNERLKRWCQEAFHLQEEKAHKVTTKYGDLSFLVTNELTQWRVDTFFTKEPETLEWIDSFDQGDIFWDIGANIGLYSLYAAIGKAGQVLSFEPGLSNAYILNRNIELNGLDGKAGVMPVALSGETAIGHLAMSMTEIGGAMSSFGSRNNDQQDSAKFHQMTPGFDLDHFVEVFQPDFPNHIKIDVDGIELLIIKGAKTVLADQRLKSLSIEIDERDENTARELVSLIEASGMVLQRREHSEMFNQGPHSQTYNYQFRKAA